MRKSGDWMSIWDDRILEYIVENDSGSPTRIANSDYIHISKQHVSNRLREIADNELLDSLGNGVYQINKKGEQYLLGNYNAQKNEFIHPELSEINVRTSPHDSQNQVRVVEINLRPESEKTAVEQLYKYQENIKSLLSPVLLQVTGTKADEELSEENVKNILFV